MTLPPPVSKLPLAIFSYAPSILMKALDLYAISLAGLAVARIVTSKITARMSLSRRWPSLDLLLCRYFIYPRIIRRHGITGPWTLAEIVWLALYIAGNVITAAFGPGVKESVCVRLGGLAVINMVLLYAALSHDLPAQVCNLTLASYGRVHRVVAFLSLGVAATHAYLGWKSADRPGATSGWTWNLLLVGALLTMTLVTCMRLSAWASGLFLRIHQGLALTCLVGLWFHATRGSLTSVIAVYAATILIGVSTAWEVLSTAWRNHLLTRGPPRATLSSPAVMKIRVSLPSTYLGRPGEYVQLWAPGGLTDPSGHRRQFMVVPGEQGHGKSGVDLLVEHPSTFRVLLVGPYGKTLSLAGFEHVLMIAWGSSRIGTFLPYLSEGSIHDHDLLRRVSIVWQVADSSEIEHSRSALNHLIGIQEQLDLLMQLSIYHESGILDTTNRDESKTKHVTCTRGVVNLGVVFAACGVDSFADVEEPRVNRSFTKKRSRDRMLVMVSGPDAIADEVQMMVSKCLHEGVRFERMEF